MWDTYIVFLLVLIIVLRIVVVVLVVLVILVVDRWRWRVIVTRKPAVHTMPVAPRVLVLSKVALACHAALGQLFHHLDELFAVVF